MSRYAMILLNRVIEILDGQEAVPLLPPDFYGNVVTAVICDEGVVLGMGYDWETGLFSDYASPEPEPPEPTEEEVFQAELLLNQVVMLENQVAQDVVLAELLLGQQGLIGQ